MNNKELINKYPFLQYRDCTSGEVIPLEQLDSTYLDGISSAWREVTLKLCDKIMRRLSEIGKVSEYRVYEVKSKFGYGRWYDNGIDPVIETYISEWETETSTTCEHCGAPAKWTSDGWISPYCDECKKKALECNPSAKFYTVHPVRFTRVD